MKITIIPPKPRAKAVHDVLVSKRCEKHKDKRKDVSRQEYKLRTKALFDSYDKEDDSLPTNTASGRYKCRDY